MAAAAVGRPVRPRVIVMGFPGTGVKGAIDDLNAEKTYDAMTVHMSTVAGNEALVHFYAHKYPELNVYGLNPGLIKTNIRGNFLGEGSLKHRIAETLIGLLMLSADEYAARILGVVLSNDLVDRSAVLFNAKGKPIQTSAGFDDAYVDEYIKRSEALVARALGR